MIGGFETIMEGIELAESFGERPYDIFDFEKNIKKEGAGIIFAVGKVRHVYPDG